MDVFIFRTVIFGQYYEFPAIIQMNSYFIKQRSSQCIYRFSGKVYCLYRIVILFPRITVRYILFSSSSTLYNTPVLIRLCQKLTNAIKMITYISFGTIISTFYFQPGLLPNSSPLDKVFNQVTGIGRSPYLLLKVASLNCV